MRPLALVVVLVALAGCTPLKHEATIELSPGEVWAMTIDGPTYQQKVTVSVKSDKGGVEGYIIKESDLKKAEGVLNVPSNKLEGEIVLGSRAAGEGPEDYTFEATVPARQAFAVVLRGGLKTNKVTLSVLGR